jgi:hypothetical protein
MVGKPENILTEFDYNNITIVDPNKVVDEEGKVKERYVNQEDLVFYANLECKMLPRTKLALGVANNDSIQTVSIASINFLKPGDKTFLDNSYTDEITGKDTVKGEGVNQPKKNAISNPNKSNDFYVRQTISSGGKPGSVDNGLLGITNITVKLDTSFLPVISVQLVDIKGRAMFESGNNSPYAAFFNLPYPKFTLTLKGYYGKAVRLELMLQNFNTRYDTSTSNFEVSLVFYTYKYTMLTEISMGMLLATPHMFKSSVQVKTLESGGSSTSPVKQSFAEIGYEKVKELYSEYKSKGLISDDFPEITLIQLQYRIENFVKNVLDNFTKQNLNPLTDIETYQRTINDYTRDVYNAQSVSWFNKYMDTTAPFILANGFKTKIYSFKSNLNAEQKQNAIAELKSLIDKYNGKLKANETLGEKGSYKIDNNEVRSAIPVKITYDKTFLRTFQSENEIDFEETFRTIKGFPATGATQINELKADFAKRNLFNASDTTLKDGQPKIVYQYFAFENNTNEIINNVSNFLDPTFFGEIDQLEKKLKAFKIQIEEELTKALSNLLQNSNNGIGFVPTIRNVLAVVFANGEAFIRLMDDTHREAWNQRNHPARKNAIFDKQVESASQDALNPGVDNETPVYPWPQFLIATTGDKGQEQYQIKYPGDGDVIQRTQGFLYDVWPEIEFEEEFIKGYVERTQPPQNQVTNFNELTEPKRISFNAIEFPINNGVFFNKEEIKFFFEIYERVFLTSNYSKLSRSIDSLSELDKIVDLIADAETENITKSLGTNNPFLLEKLKNYGFNSANYLQTLRHFSNDGTGQSWQNYLRAIFNTSYIKNLTTNSEFEFLDLGTLLAPISEPLLSLEKEQDMVDFISSQSLSNVFDLTDIYPFTSNVWCKQGLANGQSASDAKQAFSTGKVLTFNTTKKIITNFLDATTQDQKRLVTNFIYKNNKVPTVNGENIVTFYGGRTPKKQLVTEGNVNYTDYNGLVLSAQTTSIFNTPFFVNSIVEGVDKFRNFDKHPYKVPAYLFLNSLPLPTLREKYQTFETSNDEGVFSTSLNYIFASLKKFGALHRVPYPWILKIGSIWHRYKEYVDKGTDILSVSWANFNSSQNFDPLNSNPARNYGLILNGAPFDITLQKDTVFGAETSSLINTGFYPKLINDFNVFFQGYNIIDTSETINGTCSIVDNVLTVLTVNHNSLQTGYEFLGNGINGGTQILSQTSGLPGGPGTYLITTNQNVSNVSFTISNANNVPYSDQSVQDALLKGLSLNYSQESLIDYAEGFDDTNLLRDLRIIPWSILVEDKNRVNQFVFPSQGSTYNQTQDECFKNGKIVKEVNNNTAMYNGSVRMFWAAPNYGYFDLDNLIKPSPEEYLKTIFINQEEQNHFTLNATPTYTKISDIFSVFEKEVLDKFEEEFLNFSVCKYDYVDSGLIKPMAMTDNFSQQANQSTSTATTATTSTTQQTNIDGALNSNFKNFQTLFTSLMTVPKVTGFTGDQIIVEVQNRQTSNIGNVLTKFLTYDTAFKFGNPTNYDKKLFYSFTSTKIQDPYTWESYKEKTPNALPSSGGDVTVTESKANYPDAWKALETYVGFSDISSVSYSDNGSYITDFFIDFDVAFTENNIKNLATVIKIYVTQKLNQFQVDPIPPVLPSTQPVNENILEIFTFSGGSKVIIYGPPGPRKFAVFVNENNENIWTGEKISKTAGNIGLVNEALFEIYTTQGLEDPPIIDRYTAPVPQYPSTPNPQGKWSKTKLSTSFDAYTRTIDEFQNKILDSLFIKLRNKLPDVSIKSEVVVDSALEGPQSKVDLWETFKAINDKWIAGNDFKQKTLFEDVLLLDRASRNIGDVVLCDIYKLRNRLMTIDPTKNMLDFVSSILVENNFVVMNIPSYVNFYNIQDAQKNAKPRLDSTSDFANNLFGTFMNVDYRDSSAKMVCFYGGKPSEIVDIKDNVDFRFRDDAFEITKSSSNPLSENQIGKEDWDKSNKVVGFSVDIGPQNQSIFYGFNVNQGNSQSTAESLEILNQMANQAGNRAVATQNLSLYNLYKNRSYACTISMMGNAMIQPTMYFNLRHVPMFSGPYMILKVNHTINPGSFETIIEGIRQPTASLPKIDNFLQILKTNLLNSIIEESKRQKEAVDKAQKEAENVKSQQNQTNSDSKDKTASTASANQSCTANTNYSTFVKEDVRSTSETLRTIIDKINSYVKTTNITSTQQVNLSLTVFSSIYLTSYNGTGFKSNNNNFIGLNIEENWGDSPYFRKSFFCTSENKPYATFDNIDNSILFLVERWKNRMVSLPDNSTEKEIAKFWIINFASNTSGRESVYNSYPPADLSNLEVKIKDAISQYKQVIGQLNPQAPTQPPSIVTLTQRTTGERGWDVRINDTTGQKWAIYLITYRVLAPASCAFGPTESNLRIFDPPIGSNVQETFISLEEIQFDIDCDDLVEKIRFNIDLVPVFADGSPDTSRTGKTELVTSTVFI